MSRKFGITLAISALLFAACRRETPDIAAEQEEKPLEIEDVAPAIDAGLSTDSDVKGPPIVAGVSGVLPSDYPRGLPTYEPASIVDFGGTANGGSFVEFDTPSQRSTVSAVLSRRLTAAGWSVGSGGEPLRASKGGVGVRISFVDLEPGTRIRVEYQ